MGSPSLSQAATIVVLPEDEDPNSLVKSTFDANVPRSRAISTLTTPPHPMTNPLPHFGKSDPVPTQHNPPQRFAVPQCGTRCQTMRKRSGPWPLPRHPARGGSRDKKAVRRFSSSTSYVSYSGTLRVAAPYWGAAQCVQLLRGRIPWCSKSSKTIWPFTLGTQPDPWHSSHFLSSTVPAPPQRSQRFSKRGRIISAT